MTASIGPFSLERAISAVEKVRQRLLRAAAALRTADVPYAVAGDNAVALWVSRVDVSAVRTTRDVDILSRRDDFDAAKAAMESAGFVYRHVPGIDIFLDGSAARPHEAVHLVFANEKVRPQEPLPHPDVSESEDAGAFRVISLDALVRIELTAFRDKDRMHLRDLIDAGLLDERSMAKLPAILSNRLRQLLDNPEG